MVSKKELLEQCAKLGIKMSQTSSKEKIIEIIQQNERVSTTVIPDCGKKVKTVYHIADIHIRYIDRHIEYRQVFEKLYEYVKNDYKNDEESIMVIGGDIFHTRDKLASETLIIFNEFIKNITRYVKVFAILGNHDCFNHSGRLDILSGIIDLTLYENFYLLKNSGLYEYSNVCFGVSSLLDGKFTPAPKTDKKKIALYHGMINDCILDNGTRGSGNITLDYFKDYDLVMLGDIHKRQYLNKDKTAAYPGSLIQQNFKEEKNHGLLKWDLTTNSSQFVHIENDYSFTNIPMDNDLDLGKINFGKYSRIRLLLNQEDLDRDIKTMISKIEKYTNIISVKNHLKEIPLKHVEEGGVDHIEKISDKEYEIITQMTEDKPHIKDDILTLHSQLSRTIENDDMNFKESLPWCIDQVQFRNIFSYGEDILNTINLKDGITGILASNASGKTNILNTIIYGLFGNIYSRTQNQNNRNIVSRYAKKQDLFVKLTITFLTGEKYYIERTAKQRSRTKISSGKEQQMMTEGLNFYTDEKELNLSTKPDTEKLLRETLSFMGKEEFILTNMMSNISYGNNMSIISMSGTQLDEVFNNMFNLNKYKLLHKNAKLEAKAVNECVKINQAKLSMVEDNLKKYDIDDLNMKINKLSSQNVVYNSEREVLETNLEIVDSKLLKIKQTPVDEDENSILEKIKTNRQCLEEYDGDIKKLIEDEEVIEQEFSQCKKIYAENNYKKLTENPRPSIFVEDSIENLQKKISHAEGKRRIIDFSSDITNEYIKAKKFIKTIKSENNMDISKVEKSIKNLKYDDNIGSFLMESHKRDEILEDLTKQYIDPSLVLKYKKVIEDKEGRDAAININIGVDQAINDCKKLIRLRHIQDAYTYKDRLNELATKLEYIDLYLEINELTEKLNILQNNCIMNDLISEKSQLNKKISELRVLSAENDKVIFQCRSRKEDYESLVKKQSEISPVIRENERLLEVYKTYIDITHSKNLPKVLISNVIHLLCDEANKMIYNTTGLICEIQENEKWEIVVKKDKLYIGPEHCSGYERFIMNTSLKLAFDKFKQLSSIKLFLIDEVIDCVSEDNFDQIDALFENLQQHYKKIIVISHNEELKKKINNRINIHLNGKVSSIV